MRAVQKSFALILVFGILLFAFFHSWGPVSTKVNVRPREWGKIEQLAGRVLQESVRSYNHIPYHVKESVLIHLPLNGCVCESEKKSIELPFSNLLFPRVWAHNLAAAAFPDSDHEIVKSRRALEYDSFVRRSYTPTDLLIVAEANSPLQYPTQGVAVHPLKTIIIPGLGIKENPRPIHSVNLTATLGTFDVAANVDRVLIRGAGEMHMTLSSKVLPNLNRQLQFVTYTNTLFHPKTADTVQFETYEHQSVFTIKVGHGKMPKLFNSGSERDEYNISALLTIATKTFLRYDKLQDLITSIRQYYPHVTIVIADDNKHPQPVTGPHIEHYIMPFGKGWFAGRNLAVSQVTTKYVLWVDDDFLFSANTKLEKMVDILEKTTLDLVGGAVREVTGYTATFRHTISVEQGGYEGDCLHMRTGYHHTIQGFPNCVVADAVINFFLARTDKMLRVGFDPRLSRAAHLEFFVDGLGSLHIGSCSDVIVNHASKIKLPWGKSENEKAYAMFRYSPAGGGNVHDELYYFKNRFKCMTSN